jgi:hypothetical protein
LNAQRHARQVLEAAVCATYASTVAHVREVVRGAVPQDATILVVSKGDDALVQLDGRRASHFPQDDGGGYAGHYPADSAAAIAHLQALLAKGANYLLFPSTAFWWLEHYREFETYLERVHLRIWRDDRCVLFKLHAEAQVPSSSPPGNPVAQPRSPAAPSRSAQDEDGYTIVCFPIIDWDYRFQRPQQLMTRFGAAGHRVFYLSHTFAKAPEPYGLRRVAENVHEVSLRGAGLKVRQGLLDEASRRALLESLTTLRATLLTGPTVAIVQSPFWWPLAQEAAAAFDWPVVYDCLDLHAGFATSHPRSVEQEEEMLARVDLVVAASAPLETRARQFNGNVLLVRNGCDYDHFAQVRPKVRGPRPVIGYYGAIAEWFDTDLVADLAERRPDWDFLLVGATAGADLGRLSKLRNVSLPGEQCYADLPAWLAKFDVAILPFKRTPLTEAANPVKAYEILAAGRPLVSVPLPETRSLASLVRLPSTAPEFERHILAELNRPQPSAGARRRAYARANTWAQRFSVMASEIAKVCGRDRIQATRASRCAPARQPGILA